MRYKYRAVDRRGSMVSGQLEANNPTDLEGRLGKLGLDLIEAKAEKERPSLFGGSKVSRQDLVTFCFHLEQLTRAGVALLEGLVDLRDSLDHPGFRAVIANVIEDIEGGQQLSQALASHPKIFDNVFVNLIRAGEQTGELSDVLKNLVETLKWQDELASQTKKIIMYPAFAGTVIMGVVFFLMVYLVPQLVGFIKAMQQTLPLQTRILIAVSDFFVAYWWLVLMSPFILLGLFWLWRVSDPDYQYRVDGMKLKIPVVGPVLQKLVMARLANYFALMYGAGITILDCIKVLEGVVGNLVIADGLKEVRRQIAEGKSVAASFEHVNMFPPLVLRMLRVGETTGALDNSLINVSYFYNRDVKESIERVQVLIEPFMTVVMGLLLGSVMISVLGPIYDLISKLKT